MEIHLIGLILGSYSFNALLSGSIYKGFPGNKIIGLSGVEASGKTMFTLSACKHFLEEDQNNIVVFFETENAITSTILEDRGIDLKRFAMFPIRTVQDFRTQCLKILDDYEKSEDKPKMMICLDSLGNLSTAKEIEDSLKGSDSRDMTRASLLKGTFRVLSIKLGMLNVPLLVTNHVYDTLSLYTIKEQSGGSGLKYSASIIVYLSRSKEKEGSDVVGNIITCTTLKSRLSLENKKIVSAIHYNGGLDRYYGLIEIAEEAEIIKKVGNKYEFPNGKKAFYKQIINNPEDYWDNDVLEHIEKYVNKAFIYSSENIKNINTHGVIPDE